MARLNNYTTGEVSFLQERLFYKLEGCAYLQEAAQKCASFIYEEVKDSLSEHHQDGNDESGDERSDI